MTKVQIGENYGHAGESEGGGGAQQNTMQNAQHHLRGCLSMLCGKLPVRGCDTAYCATDPGLIQQVASPRFCGIAAEKG